jgi:hypothetical protein
MDAKRLLENESHNLVDVGGLRPTSLSISGLVNGVLLGCQFSRIRSIALIKETAILATPAEVGRDLDVDTYHFIVLHGKGSEQV